jgi:hypothetical protein
MLVQLNSFKNSITDSSDIVLDFPMSVDLFKSIDFPTITDIILVPKTTIFGVIQKQMVKVNEQMFELSLFNWEWVGFYQEAKKLIDQYQVKRTKKYYYLTDRGNSVIMRYKPTFLEGHSINGLVEYVAKIENKKVKWKN